MSLELNPHMNEAFAHSLRACKELREALKCETYPENRAKLQRLLKKAESLRSAMLES